MTGIALQIEAAGTLMAVTVPEGASLLAAVQAAGVALPVLCHLEGLTPVGACRLCLVAVEGVARLLPACATPAAAGMVVHPHTPSLQEYRRLTLELFFAEGNHCCAVCVAAGGCELQDLAMAVGMDHNRLALQGPQRQVDASHPRFVFDPNRCILCSRCVRSCAEIEGAHVWDVAERGSQCHLVAGLDQPWGEVEACTACGTCVAVCPTGALFAQENTVASRTPHPQLAQQLQQARLHPFSAAS